MEYQSLTHEFAPVWAPDSRILILGSFPSVKSREQGFYYGHPRNRFWNVISTIVECRKPRTIEEKRKMLLEHHIAVWDVVASCQIKGSSDCSIQNVTANDIKALIDKTEIQSVYVNGQTAGRLYEKYVLDQTHMPAIVLPSTSPANAAWSTERLLNEYREKLNFE